MAALRRDRILFVLTAALILLGAHFKPLAEASAAGASHSWILCTELGAVSATPDTSRDGALPGTDDCQKCIVGACQPHAPLKSLAAGDAVSPPLPVAAPVSWHPAANAVPLAPPPALRSIRAPPLSA